MADRLTYTKFVVCVAGLVLGVTLVGCGETGSAVSDGPSAAPAKSSAGSSPSSPSSASSTPKPSPSETVSKRTATASPDPAASGDWWPETPETLATGQKIPDDFEPATLEHPARQVPKPDMPEEAKQETEAGAQAFLNYHSDATWYAFQTGDTSLVRESTSVSCEGCFHDYDRIDRIYEQGGWIAGSTETETIISNFPNALSYKSFNRYRLPIELEGPGIKVIENGAVSLGQPPYDSAGEWDLNLDYRSGEWSYGTSVRRGE